MPAGGARAAELGEQAKADRREGEEEEEEEKEQQEEEEWYADFETLRPLLAAARAAGAAHCASVLVVGAGRSALHERIYDSGVRDVTAVAPPDVVERWRARCRAAPQHHSARPGLQLRACDVARSPGFAPAAFDAVVDRGALDRCCCAGSIGSIGAGGVGASGNANAGAAEAPPLALQALRNYHAALRAGGALVLVSHAPPALRLALLRAAGPWDGGVDVKAVSAPPLRGGGSGGAPPAAVQRYDKERHGLANAAGWAYVYVCRK